MKKYYYKDHHLYQCYCILNDQIFNTRADYLQYCTENNLALETTYIRRNSKFALEWEALKPRGWVKVSLVNGTKVFDERDLSAYYFKDEEEAALFLAEYGNGDPSFLLEALFSGYDGEPDYSPDAISDEFLKNIQPSFFNKEFEWQNIAHYIISYLPDNEDDRQARMAAHLKQLKSIKAVTPNAKVYVIAQNYRDSDYLDDPQIEYYKYGKLGAMRARNTALKHFYESSYDFCILNDDDTVVAPTQSAINFFSELESSPEKFSDIDIMWSRDMIHFPFQYYEIEKAEEYSNNWVFEYRLHNVWHYAVVRNFKKYYNKEEYQDESVDPTTGMGYDDADFCYYLHSQGYKIWGGLNTILSYALNWVLLKNSVVYTEPSNPWIRLNNKKNGPLKWMLNDEGIVDLAYFKAKCGRANDFTCAISRDEPAVNILDEFKQRNAKHFIDAHKLIRARRNKKTSFKEVADE